MCESPARCTITEHGLRCTAQRESVLETLRQAHDHPTAETLHERLEGVSLATVYNALEAFAKVGLAQPIALAGGLTRWDSTMGLHAHVRRSGDDRLEDLPEDLAGNLLASLTPRRLEQLASRLGGRIRGVQVTVLLDDEPTST
ncbi:MAG: transcriptional repressor [Phycisphaerales bacterium]|nr:transcriptional repressor [Phycisphaerales bacterium]